MQTLQYETNNTSSKARRRSHALSDICDRCWAVATPCCRISFARAGTPPLADMIRRAVRSYLHTRRWLRDMSRQFGTQGSIWVSIQNRETYSTQQRSWKPLSKSDPPVAMASDIKFCQDDHTDCKMSRGTALVGTTYLRILQACDELANGQGSSRSRCTCCPDRM